MSKFTAKEARELAGKTLEEKVDSILDAIKLAANNKKRSLRTGYEYKEDEDLWINGGYSLTQDWTDAKDMLEKLGYSVEFYYSIGSFAVDMYTIIRW